jgi:hypothetical protein
MPSTGGGFRYWRHLSAFGECPLCAAKTGPSSNVVAQAGVIGALRSRPRRALTVAPHLAMLAAIGILV